MPEVCGAALLRRRMELVVFGLLSQLPAATIPRH